MKKISLLLLFLLMMIPVVLRATTVNTKEELSSALLDQTVDVVKLGSDITLSKSDFDGSNYYNVIVPKHKTIDLNGHKLTHSDDVELRVNVAADTATFEITDSIGGGRIYAHGEFLYVVNYEDTPHSDFLFKFHDIEYENTDRGQGAFGSDPNIDLGTLIVEHVDYFYPENSPLNEAFNTIVKSLTVTPTAYNPVGFFNGKGPELVSEVVHPDSIVYQGNYFIDDWEHTLARDVFLGAGSKDKIIIKDHCTIKFQTNGGSTIDDINVSKNSVFENIKPENPTKDGYRFFSWYSDGELHNQVTSSYVVDRDLELHARYGRFYNVIAYDKTTQMANAGGFIRTDLGYEGTNNGGFILDGEPHFLEQHANPGNLFVGWVYDNPEGTPFSTDDILDLTYDGDVYGNIYAVFEKGVEVTFDTNGGTPIDNVVIRKGTKVGLPTQPTKEGYRFGGWYLSNTYYTEFDFDTELDEDITLYVRWIKTIDTINISYNVDAMPFVQYKDNLELIDWLRHNTTSNTEGTFVYENANTELYRLEGSSWTYINENSENPVTLGLEDEYAVMYSLGLDNKKTYEFPIDIRNLNFSDQVDITTFTGFTFIVNGEERNDIKIGYSESWNCIMVYVPLGHALEKVELVKPTIKVSNNNNKATVTWNEQLGAVKYRLYSSTDNKKWTKVTDTTETSYVIKSLTYGKTYYYKVRAYDIDGKSIYSAVVNKKIKPNKVNLTIKSAGTNNVKLEWEKVGVTGYEVYSSKDNKKWTKVTTITKSSTLEYNVKKLTANKTYYFKVRAYKTVNGKKYYGSYSTVLSTKTAPNKPEVTLSLRDYNEVNIVMKETKGASNYIIYKSLDGKTYEKIHDLPGPGTMADGPHEVGKTYFYQVKVCNSKGNCSGKVSLSIKQTTKTPKLTVGSTISKKVTVTVGSVNMADGYRVYRATSKNGKYELVKELKSSDELSFDNKTKKGTTYYYKVRSYKVVDGSKVYSPYSSIKSIKSK